MGLQLNPRLDRAAFERALSSASSSQLPVFRVSAPPRAARMSAEATASARRTRLLRWVQSLSNEPKKLGDILREIVPSKATGMPAGMLPGDMGDDDRLTYDAIVWLMRHDLLVELHS